MTWLITAQIESFKVQLVNWILFHSTFSSCALVWVNRKRRKERTIIVYQYLGWAIRLLKDKRELLNRKKWQNWALIHYFFIFSVSMDSHWVDKVAIWPCCQFSSRWGWGQVCIKPYFLFFSYLSRSASELWLFALIKSAPFCFQKASWLSHFEA